MSELMRVYMYLCVFNVGLNVCAGVGHSLQQAKTMTAMALTNPFPLLILIKPSFFFLVGGECRKSKNVYLCVFVFGQSCAVQCVLAHRA